MKKLLTLTVLSVFLAACTGFLVKEPDWIPAGPAFGPYNGAVDVVSDPKQITKPYGNLGMARLRGVPKNSKDIQNAVDTMTKFVAAKGATGMLIAQEAEGDGTTGTVMLVGYAIKYKDSVTPEDQKAIEQFKLIGVVDNYKK
ncbi:MAG: hypothetical protein LBI01_00900 [Elusimicrobium sp.]|jgi:hypothetical protein|nr:hypothetical protein [Elusimicrobium sp.]